MDCVVNCVVKSLWLKSPRWSFVHGLLCFGGGPKPSLYSYSEGLREKQALRGGCLEETEALVAVLPPGGILNWNAQNNQSHSHRTDVERGPTDQGEIIFLSYMNFTAVFQTHWPFFSSISSICKWYSVDLNETTICRLWRSFDITTLLIYCQLLIGTAPRFCSASPLCLLFVLLPRSKNIPLCKSTAS